MPSVMDAGGSTGSMAMSQMRFSVMSLFITLMPSPCSTMDMTEKLSSVVKRTLGVTPVRWNSAITSSSQPLAGMMNRSVAQLASG